MYVPPFLLAADAPGCFASNIFEVHDLYFEEEIGRFIMAKSINLALVFKWCCRG
jgi:hypothetical protein